MAPRTVTDAIRFFDSKSCQSSSVFSCVFMCSQCFHVKCIFVFSIFGSLWGDTLGPVTSVCGGLHMKRPNVHHQSPINLPINIGQSLIILNNTIISQNNIIIYLNNITISLINIIISLNDITISLNVIISQLTCPCGWRQREQCSM